MQCRGAGVAGASPGEFLQVPTSVWSWNAELLARSSTSVLSAAMPFELCVPDRRVRRKTWLGFEFVPDGSDPALPLPPPLPVTQDEHSLPEEVATSVKRVYLVTLPALQRQSGDSRSLVCPSTWKHQDVAAVLVDAPADQRIPGTMLGGAGKQRSWNAWSSFVNAMRPEPERQWGPSIGTLL